MTSNNSNSANRCDQNKKVFAIVSDYDGTLAPTASIRCGEGKNRIPKNLENILTEISRQIPVCILSSKDYGFLRDKVPFANIISCVLGLETVVVIDRGDISLSPNIRSRHLLIDDDDNLARTNERALNQLASDVTSQFPKIEVERKFTLDGLLVGITFDWRNQKESWSKYSTSVPSCVRGLLSRSQYCLPFTTLNVQIYDSHPFIDVYAAECDKGMGFDCIIEELSYNKTMGSILYLGDSENDNPALEKAGISIGVISDPRLNSNNLKCDYLLDYNQLAKFLELLKDNHFVFSDRVARAMKTIS
jgi:HAD superfamily hydrolase (TIGR01484 family)